MRAGTTEVEDRSGLVGCNRVFGRPSGGDHPDATADDDDGSLANGRLHDGPRPLHAVVPTIKQLFQVRTFAVHGDNDGDRGICDVAHDNRILARSWR